MGVTCHVSRVQYVGVSAADVWSVCVRAEGGRQGAVPALQGLFTVGDARSFCGLTSKITPLGSMFNFDADVKRRLRVTDVKTASDGQTVNDVEGSFLTSSVARVSGRRLQ